MISNQFLSQIILSLVWILPCTAPGGSATIERHVFPVAGGTASGGGYQIDSTLGEAVVGFATIPGGHLDSGFRATLAAVVVEDPRSFAEWISNPHVGEAPPPDQRSPSDTPANDGVKNLIKYALGLPPMEPATHTAPAMWIEPKTGKLGIVTERWKEAEVEFTVFGSPDMKNWQELNHETHILDPDAGGDRERIRLDVGNVGEPATAYFLKLQIRPSQD